MFSRFECYCAMQLARSRSLGGRTISAQTADKSVSFGDTAVAHSYGYGLVSITKRYSIFDSFGSKASAAQTPSFR
jgi:hypothetical protein